MSSMNFSTAKQTIKPPQRGIFPLDHDSECKPYKEKYLSCLKDVDDKHHLCRELSKEYLQCRMDRNLMASEDLDKVCDMILLMLCAQFRTSTSCVQLSYYSLLTPSHKHYVNSSAFQKKPRWKMQ